MADEKAKLLVGKEVDGWKMEKCLGGGANGFVMLAKKEGQSGVLKIPLGNCDELRWEMKVMEKMQDATNPEVRNWHLVRMLAQGTAPIPALNMEKTDYVVMEPAPDNPLDICKEGADPAGQLCETGNQLLKALYDMHQAGFLHRDIKPENMGLYDKRLLVLYDLGMARRYLTPEGRVREPRSYCGMRGTEEWASIWAEEGRDLGRVDDLFGWLYVMNEWVNISNTCMNLPQAWSFLGSEGPEDNASLRMPMKWENFPSALTLDNCPPAFFRIKLYLHTLGRNDTPDYFFIAQLMNETKRSVKRRNKGSSNPAKGFSEEMEFLERQFL